MLKDKLKLRCEPSLIFRPKYHRAMLLCFNLQFRLFQYPIQNTDAEERKALWQLWKEYIL